MSARNIIQSAYIRYMRDKRVVRGSALRRENLIYGLTVQSVRAQTVYRFGRERHNVPFLYKRSGQRYAIAAIVFNIDHSRFHMLFLLYIESRDLQGLPNAVNWL
jgi:hypothetical protein